MAASSKKRAHVPSCDTGVVMAHEIDVMRFQMMMDADPLFQATRALNNSHDSLHLSSPLPMEKVKEVRSTYPFSFTKNIHTLARNLLHFVLRQTQPSNVLSMQKRRTKNMNKRSFRKNRRSPLSPIS